MPTQRDFIIVGSIACAAIVGAISIPACSAGWLAKHFQDSNKIVAPVSEARMQLLNEGVAGSRKDFELFLKKETDLYFAQKGLGIDPVEASSKVGDTLNRAKTPAPAAQPK